MGGMKYRCSTCGTVTTVVKKAGGYKPGETKYVRPCAACIKALDDEYMYGYVAGYRAASRGWENEHAEFYSKMGYDYEDEEDE